MSGDRRVLLGGTQAGFVARAVQTLQNLPSELPSWAVVGGLAVYVRIGGVHRATDDLDTVSVDRARTLQILAASGAELGRRGATLPGGIHLDVIALRGPSERGSSVELARRWALDTAETLSLQVMAGGQAVAEATVPVATTPGLVAMKVHALAQRKTATKRANDAYDLVRLVEASGPAGVARSLSGAPAPLAEATAHALRYHFATHADVTLKRIRLVSAMPDAASLSEDRIHTVGRVADALEAIPMTGRSPERPPPGRDRPGPGLGL